MATVEKRMPVEDAGGFSKGGFQSILKIRGLLAGLEIVPAPKEWEDAEDKEVVEVTLEDTVILEMADGEDIFPLKDGKFSFMLNYAKVGKKPSDNSTYKKGWVDSAVRLGKPPSQFINEYVTLERQTMDLFTYKDKETGEKKTQTGTCFCFVEDETADSDSVKNYFRTLLTGMKDKAVLKAIVGDPKAKMFPEIKDKQKAGTLAEWLGMTIVDGVYTIEADGS